MQASQLIGRTIVPEDSHQRLGTISRLIIDPLNGQVLALGVKLGAWLGRLKILATSDIRGLSHGSLVIRDEEELVEPAEIVRVATILKGRTPILGQAARTVSGENIGRVDDLLIETETWMVTKYYLKHLLSERILSADQVHSITSKAVIFLDQIDEPKEAVPETEAVTA